MSLKKRKSATMFLNKALTTLSHRISFGSWVLTAVLLGGCSSTSSPGSSSPQNAQTHSNQERPHRSWRAFSDMDPVWGMTSTEEHIWVGTPDGLLRYDLAGGEPLRVSGAAGPGRGRIVSVISDEHRRVWALSENGVGRYREGAWSHPVGDVPELGELTSMSLTGERTVWVGGTKGVASNAGGRWKLWSSEEITTLTEAEDGVWVGTTAAGLWYLTEDGVVTKYLQGQELPCGSIRSVVNIDDELWALCRLSGGTTLAHFDGTRWEAWTAELSERVLDLARCRNRVVLLTDGDLWRVDRLGEDQELGGDDLPLLQLTAPIVAEPRQSKLSAKTGLTGLAKHHGRPRAEGVPFAEAPSTAREQWSESLERPALLHVKVPVYHGASLVSCDDRGVWIGTKGLGVTRIARSGEVTVYRTLDLIVTERDFSVVADSEQNAWFLSSDLRAGMLGDDYDAHFEPQEIERDATSGVQILAFGSRGLGAYALGRVRGTNVIRIYQHVRDSWVEMLERELLFNRDPADEEEEEGGVPSAPAVPAGRRASPRTRASGGVQLLRGRP